MVWQDFFQLGWSSLSTVSLCFLLRTVHVKMPVTGLFSSWACNMHFHLTRTLTCIVYCMYWLMYVCLNSMYDATICIHSPWVLQVYVADWKGYSTSMNQLLQAIIIRTWFCIVGPVMLMPCQCWLPVESHSSVECWLFSEADVSCPELHSLALLADMMDACFRGVFWVLWRECFLSVIPVLFPCHFMG